MLRRILGCALAIGVLALGLAACGGDDDDAQVGDDSTEPIVLGAAIAKDGFIEPFDTPSYQAVQLAVSDINDAGGIGGRTVEVIDANTQSDVAGSRRAAERLIDQDADVIVTSCDFDFGGPAATVAERAGKVAFSLCAQSPKFGVQGIGPLAYTTAQATFSEGAIMAAFASREDWGEPFLLVDDTISYAIETAEGFEQGWGELEGETEIPSTTFQNDDRTIASQIREIEQADPDFIAFSSYPPGGAGALRQIRAAGIDVPIISTAGMDGTFWVEAVPRISDLYVTSAVSVHGDDPNEEVNQFVEAYTATFGDPPPTGQSVNGYSLVQAIQRAAENAGSVEGEELTEALNEFQEESLLVGPTTYTDQLHIETQRPMAILRYTNGEPEYVDTIGPGFDVELQF